MRPLAVLGADTVAENLDMNVILQALQALVPTQLFYILDTMSCKVIMLHLLLERTGVRRIKSTSYIPPHPTPSTLLRAGFSLKGEGAVTCVDT